MSANLTLRSSHLQVGQVYKVAQRVRNPIFECVVPHGPPNVHFFNFKNIIREHLLVLGDLQQSYSSNHWDTVLNGIGNPPVHHTPPKKYACCFLYILLTFSTLTFMFKICYFFGKVDVENNGHNLVVIYKSCGLSGINKWQSKAKPKLQTLEKNSIFEMTIR